MVHVPLHSLHISLVSDRGSNPRPLAYGNSASIKGTTTLTTKPNPLLQNRRFNAQGHTYVVPLHTLREMCEPICVSVRLLVSDDAKAKTNI
jgi:hypothetical protein